MKWHLTLISTGLLQVPPWLYMGLRNQQEIFEDWIEGEVEFFEGVPIVSVDGLIKMKEKLGREKDLALQFRQLCALAALSVRMCSTVDKGFAPLPKATFMGKSSLLLTPQGVNSNDLADIELIKACNIFKIV